MPSIQQFARESESTTVTVRDIPIAVTYNPDRVSVRDMEYIARLQQTLDFGGIADFLDKMIESWDVTGPLAGEDEDAEEVELVADGEVIPFTRECMETLGMLFVTEFIETLMNEAMRGPNPTKRPKSGRSRKR